MNKLEAFKRKLESTPNTEHVKAFGKYDVGAAAIYTGAMYVRGTKDNPKPHVRGIIMIESGDDSIAIVTPFETSIDEKELKAGLYDAAISHVQDGINAGRYGG